MAPIIITTNIITIIVTVVSSRKTETGERKPGVNV